MTTPSAPELTMNGSVGWKSTASTPSLPFSRWLEISCIHVYEPSRFQKRIEQSWPPDTSENPVASIDREVTASVCAAIECVHVPASIFS